MILLEEIEKVELPLRLTAAHLKKIAQAATLKECPADEVIFREGEHNPFIYFVLSGEVDLEMRVPCCGRVHVLSVGPGELLGWSSLLGAPMTATARVVSCCRLAVLDAAQIQALAEEDPKFGMEFFRGTSAALAQRLYAARVEIPRAAHGMSRIRGEPSE